MSWLPCDDTDALRFCVRFVCTSATLVGVVGRDRNAAAAAADEREEVDARRANAEAAAVAAFGFAVAAVNGWLACRWRLEPPNMFAGLGNVDQRRKA